MTERCPKCGEELESDTDECSNCGEEITEDMNLHDNGSNSLAFYQTSSPKWIATAMISALVIFSLIVFATSDIESGEGVREVPSGSPEDVVREYMGSIEPLLLYDMENAYSLTVKQSADNVSEFKEQRMLNRDIDDQGTTSINFEDYEVEELNKYNATVTVHRKKRFRGFLQGDSEINFNLVARNGKWKIVNPPNIYGEDVSCSGADCYE